MMGFSVHFILLYTRLIRTIRPKYWFSEFDNTQLILRMV